MTVHILHLRKVESVTTDLKIRRLKDTDVERLPAVYEYPLPEVKLSPTVNEKWLLDVLLYNLLLRLG